MTCPTCGGGIEASAPMWLTLTADGWTVHGIGSEDVSYYCGNDHPIPQANINPRDIDNLTDLLRELEQRCEATTPA